MPGLILTIIVYALGYAYGGWLAVAINAALITASAVYSSAQSRKARRALEALRDKASGLTLSFRDPIAPRRVVYGTRRLGGSTVFGHCTGIKNEFLHLIVAITGHECEDIGDVYFSDEIIPTSGTAATGRLAGFSNIAKHLGSPTQTADAGLMADAPSIWTSNHRLQGIAYIYVKLQYDIDKYPGGIPGLSAIIKGRKVYDPRSGTTYFSNNPALCIRDYLTDPVYGMGCDSSEMDDTTIIAAANICDELVTLADGVTQEVRYACDAVIETNVTPVEALEALLRTMAGSAIYTGGKWRLYAGAWRAPIATFTMADLRGPILIQTADSTSDACNAVKGTYIDAHNGYQPADFPPIENSLYLSEDEGVKSWRDLDLSYTLSPSMSQRIAKIELERSRQDIAATLPLNLCGLQVQAGDVVQLDMSRYGWSGKYFEILDWKFAAEEVQSEDDAEGGAILGIDVVVRETDAAIFDWANGEETTIDLAPNTTLPSPFNVPAPTGVALLSDASTLVTATDGTIIQRIKVSWTAAADKFVTSGGSYHIEYKLDVAATWIGWSDPRGDKTEDYITDVTPSAVYDVRICAVNVLGVRSPFVTITGYTVPGKSAGPAAPTGLALANTDGVPVSYFGSGTSRIVQYGAKVKWDAPADTDVMAYRYKTAQFADGSFGVTPPTVTMGFAHQLIYTPGAFLVQWLWVQAVNTSGIPGAWAGPILLSWADAAGTFSSQDSNNGNTTGFKMGGTSSVKQTAQVPFNTTSLHMTGGDTSESWVIVLANGLPYKADWVNVDINYPSGIIANYDWDSSENDANHAACIFRMADGSNLPSGTIRVSGNAGTFS
jgi:hypothetical protein